MIDRIYNRQSVEPIIIFQKVLKCDEKMLRRSYLFVENTTVFYHAGQCRQVKEKQADNSNIEY